MRNKQNGVADFNPDRQEHQKKNITRIGEEHERAQERKKAANM
jgi:hypothetical protein